MVKAYENLDLFGPDSVQELSILRGEKHNQAVGNLNSRGLQSTSLVVARGLRKSSSLTNGIGPGRNKTALKEYGTEARGLDLSAIYTSVNAPILGTR